MFVLSKVEANQSNASQRILTPIGVAAAVWGGRQRDFARHCIMPDIKPILTMPLLPQWWPAP